MPTSSRWLGPLFLVYATWSVVFTFRGLPNDPWSTLDVTAQAQVVVAGILTTIVLVAWFWIWLLVRERPGAPLLFAGALIATLGAAASFGLPFTVSGHPELWVAGGLLYSLRYLALPPLSVIGRLLFAVGLLRSNLLTPWVPAVGIASALMVGVSHLSQSAPLALSLPIGVLAGVFTIAYLFALGGAFLMASPPLGIAAVGISTDGAAIGSAEQAHRADAHEVEST